MQSKQLVKEKEPEQRTKVEMADAHAHLDLFDDLGPVKESVAYGVSTIITNGVDTKSNIKAIELHDNRNIYAALGIDPEHVKGMEKGELDFNLGMIRQHRGDIVALGEIGLDYKLAVKKEDVEEQKRVFGTMLDLAVEMDLPVCIHSRESVGDVIEMLSDKSVKKAMLHFFSGDEHEAMAAVRKGYIISVPPMDSSKRRRVIKAVPIDSLVVESDCPAAGASPRDVERAIRMVCEVKAIGFEKAAERLTLNTKRFFNIKSPLMRI